MRIDSSQKLALYAEGEFAGSHSKTAEGVLRYCPDRVVSIVDSRFDGRTAEDVLGWTTGGPVTIVDTVERARQAGAEAILLGCAFTGGRMPERWRKDIIRALELGLDVFNGLHDFLVDDPEIVAAAERSGRKLIDLRSAPDKLPVAMGRAAAVAARTVLTVGTDCSVGKMTVSLELNAEARRRGRRSRFVATGQTGIMIDGWGVAIDRVIGDFMAGAIEELVVEAAQDADFVFIEGQGAICHPGYAGVTTSLLHGSAPECLVLCHQALRKEVGSTGFLIPDPALLVDVYEKIASFVRPTKVVAGAVNTFGLDEGEARRQIEQFSSIIGCPVSDPVRFGAGPIMDAIDSYIGVGKGALTPQRFFQPFGGSFPRDV